MILMMKANKGVLSLFQRKDLMLYDECRDFLQSFSDEMALPLPIDIKLKHSQYTIEKHKDRTYVLYNTLYNSMVTMSYTEFEQYRLMTFDELDLVGVLADNGFLIPDYTDEFKRCRYYQTNLASMRNDELHLTVALTTKCNAKCIYCYEEGVCQSDMSLKTAERFAQLILNSKKDIDITWFGGEPLIKNDLIECICKMLHKNDVKFTSGIITNGSLLNKEMIETKFSEWNISWVQITLDGMSEEYMRRKRYIDTKSDIFDDVIENIGNLLSYNINVSVRLNTDSENREECIRTARFLKEKFADNAYLNVYPAFLTGNNALTESERMNYSTAVYKTYSPELNLLSEVPRIYPCFFEQPGAFVIDTDGSVLCCERDIGKQHTKISSIYDIESFDNLEKIGVSVPKMHEQCKRCVYYPKCGGGCKAAYDSKCKYDACFMERYKTEYLINKVTGY